MNERPVVIKIGGRALSTQPDIRQALLQRLRDIIALHQSRPCVLLHGGGDLIDEWLAAFGRTTDKIDGQRLTTDGDMPIIAGALAGALNTQLVAACNRFGQASCGVSLLDGNGFLLHQDAARGAVGVPDFEHSNATYIATLLEQGYLPVVNSVGMLANGRLVNVNADLAAAAVAACLDGDLILLTDVAAIYDKQGQPLTDITLARGEQLIANAVVRDGMQVKLAAAMQATALSRRTTAVASWQGTAPLTAVLDGSALASHIRL